YQMLEQAAQTLESRREYDAAEKLLSTALSVREGSADYGLGLLKLADLETKRNRAGEAEAFYTKALTALGDRPESAPALLFLGFRANDPKTAVDYFQKARTLDPAHAGIATMWMATTKERERPAEAEDLY